MERLKSRLAEPSTHAGIAGLLQAAKMFAPQYSFLFDALTAFFASFAVVLPERVRD